MRVLDFECALSTHAPAPQSVLILTYHCDRLLRPRADNTLPTRRRLADIVDRLDLL